MKRKDWLQNKPRPGKSSKLIFKYSIGDAFESVNNSQNLEIINRGYNLSNIPVYYIKNSRPHNEDEIDTMLKRGFWKEIPF